MEEIKNKVIGFCLFVKLAYPLTAKTLKATCSNEERVYALENSFMSNV